MEIGRLADGNITFYNLDGKEYILNQGETLVMPAKKPHSVHAVEAFKMMLVVIFPLEQD